MGGGHTCGGKSSGVKAVNLYHDPLTWSLILAEIRLNVVEAHVWVASWVAHRQMVSQCPATCVSSHRG